MTASPNLPGRLGTPDMELKDDPRADPARSGERDRRRAIPPEESERMTGTGR